MKQDTCENVFAGSLRSVKPAWQEEQKALMLLHEKTPFFEITRLVSFMRFSHGSFLLGIDFARKKFFSFLPNL